MLETTNDEDDALAFYPKLPLVTAKNDDWDDAQTLFH